MSILIERAILKATRYHVAQRDKVGEPYILHPIRVMLTVSSLPERCVAVLHDVLEDTSCTEQELRENFTNEIVNAVVAITKVEGETYQEYLKKVKANPIARTVKIADVRDNASPIRLYKLDPKTVQRLTLKYLKAIKYLEAE